LTAPTPWHRTGWLVVLALAMLLGGCSWFVPKLEKPRLSIIGVELVKADVFEQRMRVRVRVQNPNDRELPIKGLSYDMEVAGQAFAHGLSANSFVVPAFGEAEFDMNVTANVAGTLIALLGRRDAADGDAIAYRLVGKVALSRGLLREIPFDQNGTFKLR
jgi:LEA14-like dessication related protein